METKLSKLIAHARAGAWREALRIAARFPQLGDEGPAIKRAHEAFDNAGFYRQIGRNPDALIEAGIEALKQRYKIDLLIGEVDMTEATAHTATTIDTLTATLTGKTVKRANSKGAAVERFCLAASKRGVDDQTIETILQSPTPAADLDAALRQVDTAQVADLPQVEQATVADAAAPAAPKARPVKAPKEKAPKAPAGKRADALAAAQAGTIPEAPDMSAPTHKSWVKRLDAIKAMVEARDVAGLKADTTEPKSSSRAMICRYRDQAIIAIEAQQAGA